MKKIALFLAIPSLLYANSATIYLDKTVLFNEKPQNGTFFLGYNNEIKAYCGNNELFPLVYDGEQSDCFLCKLEKERILLEKEKGVLSENIKLNQTVISKISFDKADLQGIKSIVKYMDELLADNINKQNKITDIDKKLANLHILVNQSTKSKKGYGVDLKNCPSITSEFKGVSVKVENYADLSAYNYTNSKLKGDFSKKLLITNRSGVDIKNIDAEVILSKKSENFFVPQFAPWIISRIVRVESAKMYKKSMPLMAAAPAPQAEEAIDSQDINNVAEKDTPVSFKIKNLTIPSDGIKKSFDVESGKVDVEIVPTVFTFSHDNNLYRIVKFKSPFDVENMAWNLSIGKEKYENIAGTMQNGYIEIPAGIDREVIVKRESNVKFKTQEGIFGGKKRIKEGYKILLNNLSNSSKEVNILDKIPVSTDNEISVESLNVTGAKAYKLLEKGKLSMNIILLPSASLEVIVTFDVVTDKDIELHY